MQAMTETLFFLRLENKRGDFFKLSKNSGENKQRVL